MSVATHAALTPAPQQLPGRKPRTSAEAARYGVLRRLAPALKHDMVVNLQAVAMMAEVLNAKLEKGSPLAELEGSVSRVNRLAREAVMTCLKVAAWIAPSEDESARLHEGIDECVALLRSGFNFRGCTLTNEVPETDFEASRVALRHLVAASLLSLADAAGGPADLVVASDISPGFAVLIIRCTPRPQEDRVSLDAIASEPTYRALEWADVQALALAEGIELFRTQDQIVLRMPRMVPTTPLQIVPL